MLAAVGLSGCAAGAAPGAGGQTAQTPAASAPEHAEPQPGASAALTASDVLASLPVKGPAPKTGYDRVADFGAAWLDVDGNGCDTRNDVLARDLTNAVRAGTCTVTSGTLDDPYTGTTITFTRGVTTSRAVQIDHVVALQNAWQSGAQQLDGHQRTLLANDPVNLLAVDGPTNEAKGSRNAASWLPPNKAFRCQYVARQVSVKAAYRLWVTPSEHDAMQRVLATCPGQAAYRSTLTGDWATSG